MINIIQPTIYENCVKQPIKLYKNLDINLSYQWTNRVPKKKRRRRRKNKPANFKILYKRLYFLKIYLNLKKYSKSQFTIPTKTKVYSQNKFYIFSNDSYFIRALNNSLIYNKQNLQSYKFSKFKGFTFNKEKILDIKRLPTLDKNFSSNLTHRPKDKNKSF